MGIADDYLRRANEADRQARAAISSCARAEFEKIANDWRNLARQAEELDRMDREGYPLESDLN
jgi:hypothetical protein